MKHSKWWDQNGTNHLPTRGHQNNFTEEYAHVAPTCWLRVSRIWKNKTLVGGWATPLKKIWKSVGIILPNIRKKNSHVPKHQPGQFIDRQSSDMEKKQSIHHLVTLQWASDRCPFIVIGYHIPLTSPCRHSTTGAQNVQNMYQLGALQWCLLVHKCHEFYLLHQLCCPKQGRHIVPDITRPQHVSDLWVFLRNSSFCSSVSNWWNRVPQLWCIQLKMWCPIVS